ncbi:MAG TPA: hypothetical protein VI670_27705 [Thermoanaerobaculia bacterium]|jgi:hypothetical protein
MKKGVYFLLGTGAALLFKGPMSWLMREAAIGAMRAKRNLGRAMDGVKEDLEDLEAEAKNREEARARRRAVPDTSVS